jgi:ribonuclease T1
MIARSSFARTQMAFRSSFAAACLAWCIALAASCAWGRGFVAEIPATELPRDARIMLDLIARGGPFQYDRDGVVFGNRERILPDRPRGYYHEYTVQSRGARSRGARRIVCGGAPQSTSDCYYSDDHYRTFKRIR